MINQEGLGEHIVSAISEKLTTAELPLVPDINEREEQSAETGGLFSNRNFRFLWLGEAISLIGDQFYLIALPWLVLQLTGDALVMGTVLALGGIPRALFMLVGGAVTDRFSPRNVMLSSNLLRMGLVALLTILVLSGATQLWMIYAISLLFGLADAFFFPAQMAIIPTIVHRAGLQGANAIVQGTAQLSLFLGPVLAGAIIAVAATSGDEADLSGIGVALGFDALTFLVSAATLYAIRIENTNPDTDDDEDQESVMDKLRAGLVYVWNDKLLRGYFIMIAISNLFVNGPVLVGIPVLADARFTEGAAAFGIIMSAFGGGSLIGTILGGVLPKPKPHILGNTLMLLFGLSGLSISGLAFAETTWVAAGFALLQGVTQGYVVISFITWLQARTPEALLGRMMSLLMFASVGLLPIATSVVGALVELNMSLLFLGAGIAMASTVLIFGILIPELRWMDYSSPKQQA